MAERDIGSGPDSCVDTAMATGAASLPFVRLAERAVDLIEQAGDRRYLWKLLQCELIYRLLQSPMGARMRQIVLIGTQSNRIARAIHWLREHYRQPIRIDALAGEVGISVSTFHHHFRAITSMSPLQYQKQLRLHEARRLLLAERIDAATAAFRVGYESPTQFSREYRRPFGLPPMRDALLATRTG